MAAEIACFATMPKRWNAGDREDVFRLGDSKRSNGSCTAHPPHFQADVLSGDAAFDDNFEQVITGLYATWLAVSEVVEPWVAKLENRGYTVGGSGQAPRVLPGGKRCH